MWSNRSKRPAPEHGIKLQEGQRNWWSQRWIQAIEAIASVHSNRLARGRSYARTGRAFDFDIKGGTLCADVIGTRNRPYRVKIQLTKISAATWRDIVERIRTQTKVCAQLGTDSLPTEIEELFSACNAALFPKSPSDLNSSCSCPDTANPCKHIAAVLYGMAQILNHDPLLLFDLRGFEHEKLLKKLETKPHHPTAQKPPTKQEASDASPVTPTTYDAAPDPEAWQDWESLKPGTNLPTFATLHPPARWDAEESPQELLSPIIEHAVLHARQFMKQLGEHLSEDPNAKSPPESSTSRRKTKRKATRRKNTAKGV